MAAYPRARGWAIALIVIGALLFLLTAGTLARIGAMTFTAGALIAVFALLAGLAATVAHDATTETHH